MEKMDLIDLQRILEDAVSRAFEEPCWVRAEISQLSVRNGHCHMELVQKEQATDKLLAKAQAVIWAGVFSILNPYFRTSTGMDLRPGLQVLLCVEPRMHPLYGLSLVVTDVDPSYTIGGLELERRKTMERLEREGILDMNRQLPFPAVPLHLAVISSETAAGYQDFQDHIRLSPYGFKLTLFPALMQGTDAPTSIIRAMEQVIGSGKDFDLLVMIRGGGAATDLHCYDNYDLAAHIAQFPIPVVTGIGHHKDVHIADRVASLSLKTPTAVADYLDGHLAAEEESLFRISHNLERAVQRRIDDEKQSLNYLIRDIGGAVRWVIQQHGHLLELLEQRIKQNNPMTLLQKGYSLTLFRGKALLDASHLKEGDKVDTILSKGSFGAIVNEIEN
ncbi:MAG: exodeoxyribonuclease VII large subunit [Bacteroidales bacterium]|jgi:exodeoxyribonuclease VII large subunit|nr:exodeoxyribonuclease VII large subunit [Bacteroidales bacterium]